MDNSSFALVLFLVLLSALALVPKAVRWLQQRQTWSASPQDIRVVSAIAVGTQHKVVLLAVGAGTAQTHLVLGVGPQAIHCLHTLTPQREHNARPEVAP